MGIYAIKKFVKDSIPFSNILSEHKRICKCKNILSYDLKKYKRSFIKYSTSLSRADNSQNQRRIIVINTHIIEKGLSHTNYKPGFGHDVIVELQNNLKMYLDNKGSDTFAVKNAVSVLREYHSVNMSYGYDDSKYLNVSLFDYIQSEDIKSYEIKSDSTVNSDILKSIIMKRHSVRLYDSCALKFDKNVLLKVLELANTAPSACNRQAVHVFAVSDNNTLKLIEQIHGGCKGFGRNASAMLFVTSDFSLYSSTESKLPLYDAGIYTMNLVYSLQSYGLYSCVLNGSFSGKSYYDIYKIMNIPNNFEICGLIAVYKLRYDSAPLIAASPRRNAEDTVTFINWN